MRGLSRAAGPLVLALGLASTDAAAARFDNPDLDVRFNCEGLPPITAADAADGVRFGEEMTKLANRNAWAGVIDNYEKMVALEGYCPTYPQLDMFVAAMKDLNAGNLDAFYSALEKDVALPPRFFLDVANFIGDDPDKSIFFGDFLTRYDQNVKDYDSARQKIQCIESNDLQLCAANGMKPEIGETSDHFFKRQRENFLPSLENIVDWSVQVMELLEGLDERQRYAVLLLLEMRKNTVQVDLARLDVYRAVNSVEEGNTYNMGFPGPSDFGRILGQQIEARLSNGEGLESGEQLWPRTDNPQIIGTSQLTLDCPPVDLTQIVHCDVEWTHAGSEEESAPVADAEKEEKPATQMWTFPQQNPGWANLRIEAGTGLISSELYALDPSVSPGSRMSETLSAAFFHGPFSVGARTRIDFGDTHVDPGKDSLLASRPLHLDLAAVELGYTLQNPGPLRPSTRAWVGADLEPHLAVGFAYGLDLGMDTAFTKGVAARPHVWGEMRGLRLSNVGGGLEIVMQIPLPGEKKTHVEDGEVAQ